MFKKTLLASSILLLVSTAQAEGGYIGASIGQTDVDIPTFSDGDSLAFTAGYRIDKNFAFEASYIDLGEFDDDIAPVWTIKADGFNFAAVGIIPINNTFEVFGKVGMYIWDFSVSEAGFGEFYSSDGNDISFGFGASANLTDQFNLIFEYQKFEVDDQDASNISFGARLNF